MAFTLLYKDMVTVNQHDRARYLSKIVINLYVVTEANIEGSTNKGSTDYNRYYARGKLKPWSKTSRDDKLFE